MKLSIITCTYNRLEKIKKNINSVRNQNYQNYEHIILDDGSNDGTKDYFLKIEDKKIKYYRFEENLGQPSILFYSKVFEKISGDYVIFLDSDDYLFDGAFDVFFKYYSIHGDTIWNYAFDLSDKKQKNFKMNDTSHDTRIVSMNSEDCFRDNHPRNMEKKGYRDFLNFRNKIFYDKIAKYFITPDFWYSALYEVGLHNQFKEMYIYKKIYFMNFEEDSVTRGFNIDKYKNHTLISRENIFNKYKDKMDMNFFLFSLKSLIMNYLVNKNCKMKLLRLLINNSLHLRKNIFFMFLILFLFLFPHKFLIYLKKKIKFFKVKRY